MGALFGSLSALMIGFADLFARRTVAASSALTAAVVVQFTAVAAALLCILGFGGTYAPRDVVLGGLSGVALGGGFGLYYGGIDRSSATIISPMVATLSAVIPFVYTVVNGASPSLYALLGAGVALAGISLITVGGGKALHLRIGLTWGAGSGLCYGIAFALVIEATADAGSWPAVWQRIGAGITLGAVAARSGARLSPPVGVRFAAVLAGICSALCTIFYLVGVRAEPTTAVITASMFPAASVAVGRLFFQDPVSRVQGLGLLVVLAGVIGVVAG